jgi:hypothetical protein
MIALVPGTTRIKIEALSRSSIFAKRFKPSCNFCTSFLSSLFVPAFPSYPLAVLGQAILGIEQPIARLARGTPRQ